MYIYTYALTASLSYCSLYIDITFYTIVIAVF